MKTILQLFLVLLPLWAFADADPAITPVVEEVVNEHEIVHRKSHWITTYAFEGMAYNNLPFGFPQGVKKQFDEENRTLIGGRIGFGGQIHLGFGLITTSMVEGYYYGTLFASKVSPNQDDDVDLSYSKKTGQIFGGDVSQSLGYIFNLKTKNPFMDTMTYLTIEPFVEAGAGVASAWNKIDYKYELNTINERYEQSFKDKLANAKIGAGINFTSNEGFFLTLKVTHNRYKVLTRESSGYYMENGSTSEVSLDDNDIKNAKIDPVTIYTLGGGYKF